MTPGTQHLQGPPPLPDIKEAYPLIETSILTQQQWTYLWAALGILLTLCFFFAIYQWMKRPKKEYIPTPLERALSKLSQAESLLQKQDIKAFSQSLSWALREYIQHRHRIPALELTTEEFSKALKQRAYLNEAEANQILSILKTCDTLKFSAQGIPEETLTKILDEAKAFLSAESKEEEATA